MRMSLETTLADIIVRLRQGRFANEQAVSQGIVLRVLQELGWDIYDTTAVWPEFQTGEGRADFALCHPPSKPAEFIVLRSRTLTPEFVYLLARSDEFRGNAIKSMSGASGRQRVQERCFDEFKIVDPPRALLDRFSAIVAPSFRLIYKLHLQIQNLR